MSCIVSPASMVEGPVFVAEHRGGVLMYGINAQERDLFGWMTFPGECWDGAPSYLHERCIMAFVGKVQGQRSGDGPVLAPDKETLKRWPCLWEYLTLTSYPDGGGDRQTATLTVFWGSQGLTATLNDRDNARACFATAPTFVGLLDALEGVASHPDTVWRNDRNQTGNSNRKKK